MNQKQIWEDEHKSSSAIPSLAQMNPTQGLIHLFDVYPLLIQSRNKALDIGCGKGRNMMYLATFFDKVTGIDYIQSALDFAQKFAIDSMISHRCEFVNQRIDKFYPFESNMFDFVLDSFASIDVETLEGRIKCRDECYRVLKPGGYMLVLVVSADDPMEKHFIESQPGPEPNSCYWPTNGKFQKDYDEQELIDFFKNGGFSVVELKKFNRPAYKLNQNFIDETFWLLLHKEQ